MEIIIESDMLKLIDPLTDKRWDDFIIGHQEGTIYHHSIWTRVLVERYGNRNQYYILENNNGEILGALPFFHLRKPIVGNQLICLPSADSCFPLINKINNEGLLIEAIQEIIQNRKLNIQIRGWSRSGLPQQSTLRRGLRQWLVQNVDLNRDLGSIRAGMTRNGRYNLRKAEKQSVIVKLGQDEKDLRLFYNMLVDTLHRSYNILPPGYSFFLSILRNVIIPGYGCLFFAEHRGKIIASNLYLCFKDTALCKYSAQMYNYSEYRPNDILHWKAMEYFHNKSFKFYDFGGTKPMNEGLLRFKRNWGGIETSRSFYFYPAEIDYSVTRLNKVLHWFSEPIEKCLPNVALKLLSNVITNISTD